MNDDGQVKLPELPITISAVLEEDLFLTYFEKIYPYLGLLLCWIQRQLVAKMDTPEKKGMAVEVVTELDKILAGIKPKPKTKKKASTKRPSLKPTK